MRLQRDSLLRWVPGLVANGWLSSIKLAIEWQAAPSLKERDDRNSYDSYSEHYRRKDLNPGT